MTVVALSLLLSATIVIATDDGSPAPPETQVIDRLPRMLPAFAVLGLAWTGQQGIVIDDLNNLPDYPEPVAERVAELVEELRQVGVRACADYTYFERRRDQPPNVVTLRILLFTDTAAARAHWAAKYEAEATAGFYDPVEGIGARALDTDTSVANQPPKRVVLAGNALITCHTLRGEDHLRVLERYLASMGLGHRKPLPAATGETADEGPTHHPGS